MQTICRALFIADIAAAVTAAQQGNSATRPERSNPNQTPAGRCSDVTKLDVRNLTIRTAQREFAFHKGIAINSDGFQAPEQSTPDWKAEIVEDKIIHPTPNVVVRFLVIHDSHESGSGWQIYATGLVCAAGKLHEVFHRDGMSLDVDRLDSTTINVSLNVIPGKPTRKHFSYTWDLNTSKYLLSSTRSTPR